MFGQRRAFGHVTGKLTAEWYINEVIVPVVQMLVQAASVALLQQTNA